MQDNMGSIIFIIFYLVFIWYFILKIIAKNNKENTLKNQPSYWKWIFLSYFLLGFGDLFHLGFRIYIYFAGLGPDEPFTNLWFARGYVITGISMTYFYVAMLHAWKEIYGKLYFTQKQIKRYFLIEYLLFILRIILVFLPYNRWYEGDATVDFGFDFRIISSLPLYGIGILSVYLIMKTSKKAQKDIPKWKNMGKDIDPLNRKINTGMRKAGICFIVSYLCYSVTNLFVAIEPLLGMAMIPKTIAYMVAFYFHYKYILKGTSFNKPTENLPAQMQTSVKNI